MTAAEAHTVLVKLKLVSSLPSDFSRSASSILSTIFSVVFVVQSKHGLAIDFGLYQVVNCLLLPLE